MHNHAFFTSENSTKTILNKYVGRQGMDFSLEEALLWTHILARSV